MKPNKYDVFFVNPMGYGTMGKYDYSILSNLKNISLLYFCNALSTIETPEIDKLKLFDYSNKRSYLKVPTYLKAQFRICSYAIKYKPRTIHYQWFKLPYIDIFFIRWFKRKNIKTIFTVHNVVPHSSGSKYRFIFGKLYRTLDVLIVHTIKTKELLVQEFKVPEKNIQVVPHGLFETEKIDLEEKKNYKARLTADKKLNQKLVFGILGRINKYKGIDLIVEAWGNIDSEKRKDFHLIIAGQGKSEALNTLLNDDNVTILNEAISNEKFYGLLELMDFVLLPYLEISQSGFLLTALNNKKRLIVSNVGGLTQPFQFGDIGYVLDELSSDDLKNKMLLAAGNADSFPDQKVWDAIFEYYDWKTIGKMTQQLY